MTFSWFLLMLLATAYSSVVKTPKWKHSVWLGEDLASPRLFWASQDDYLYFLVEANTIGSIWMEFDDFDAVIIWVDDATGAPQIQDYHLVNGSIVRDNEANYDVIGGDQNNTHSSVIFRRLWNICDQNDVTLGADTVRISWSMHAHDPGLVSNDIAMEEDTVIALDSEGAVYGEKSLLLQTPVMPSLPSSPAVYTWDVLMRNVVIEETMPTQYWCKIFRSPPLSRKHHIIAYQPLLLSPSESMVHHLLLYECNAPSGYLDSFAVHQHPGAPCYSPKMPTDWETCVTPVATWVLGGSAKIFPDHIGIPVGPRQTYYMLEVHYDNPGLRRALDNSGFRLFHTEEIRQFDAGVFQTGVMVTPLHIIPPLQPDYLSVGLCNDACTNKMLPEKGIKVVSVLLHSHLAGRAIRVRHLRGDHELPHIVEDNKYDFAYQQDRMLKDEVIVFPGDQLLTECQYDTSSRKITTFGGYSTRDEMCLAFVTYYPRVDMASCHSMSPVFHVFNALGIRSFHGITMEQVERFVLRTGPMPRLNKTESVVTMQKFESDAAAIEHLSKMPEFLEDIEGVTEESLLSLTIKEPPEFAERDLARHLQGLPWTDSVYSHSFEQSLARGLHMGFCRTRSDSLAVPLDITLYPAFKEFEKKSDLVCASTHSLAEDTSASFAPPHFQGHCLCLFLAGKILFLLRL